jgi:Cyclophilin type peptidyl-prolyl cis-trans isomerase/CLD
MADDQQQQPTGAAAASASASPWTHVLFETSIGRFVIELYYKHTPRTAYNIAALANQGYYDNTIFHRIIRDFVRECACVSIMYCTVYTFVGTKTFISLFDAERSTTR